MLELLLVLSDNKEEDETYLEYNIFVRQGTVTIEIENS